MSDPRAWRHAGPVAFEGTGFAVPFSVGALTLLYARIGTELMAPGVLAVLLGMVVMHLACARHGRPLIYAARVLETSMLIGFLDQFILKMPGWGLADTPAHRLLLTVAVSVGAALLLPMFFALRLQRFARMIPTPVFAGFSTALALTVLISQSAVLWKSRPADGPWFIAIAAIVLGVAIGTQRLAPRLPHGVTGLATGMLVALLLGATGLHALRAVTEGGPSFSLPVSLVTWSDAWADGVDTGAILRDVLLASFTLTVLVFLNTVVNQEAVTQLDGREPAPRDWWRTSAATLAVTLIGSPVLTPSLGATRAALRVGALDGRALVLVAALVVAVFGTGVLSLVPLAGICGLLLFDAWTSFDRPSLRLAWQWARGRRPSLTEREDLATIGLVAVSAVLFNIVTGVAIGVFAGLILYAWRNGRRLARSVETGALVRSNATRSRQDAALLAQQAERIGFVALEGALFFGAAGALQALLRKEFRSGRLVVVDWSHVVSADSTVASAFARVVAEAVAGGAQVAISGLDAAGRQVADTVAGAAHAARLFPDADRALEWAENEVIRSAAPAASASPEGTTLQDALSLLHGLAAEQRDALELLFEQRFFRAGDTVFEAGQVDSELMVILQGSVDILVPHGQGEGRDVRLARIRRGAMLGELSFLDAAARAASAVATEDVLMGVLSRPDFDAFARQWPQAGVQVLTNLSLDLAFRLRRTNHIAVSQLR